jgi:hypothetical protein
MLQGFRKEGGRKSPAVSAYVVAAKTQALKSGRQMALPEVDSLVRIRGLSPRLMEEIEHEAVACFCTGRRYFAVPRCRSTDQRHPAGRAARRALQGVL